MGNAQCALTTPALPGQLLLDLGFSPDVVNGLDGVPDLIAGCHCRDRIAAARLLGITLVIARDSRYLGPGVEYVSTCGGCGLLLGILDRARP